MRIIFMGTDEFGILALTALANIEKHEIVAVVTQPDRAKKRNPLPTPTPIKEVAIKLGLHVFQPEKLRSDESISYIKSLSADLIVTASYGQILPKSILDSVSIAAINIHASLLPKYRGAAPIHRAIMDGQSKTGITLMHMDVGLDTGDMIDILEVEILDTDTIGTLYKKLSQIGADLLMRNLKGLEDGTAKRIKQKNEQSTYAKMLSKEDEKIDWNQSAHQISNQIRALDPKPGAYAILHGQTLKIWTSETQKGVCERFQPGTIIGISKKGIEVSTRDGALLIKQVQLAGKKRMDAFSFANGYKDLVGIALE